MRDYLSIKLTDAGSYHETDDEMDLNLECDIDFITGEFEKRQLDFNTNAVYTPVEGHKFYFLPGVTVPRVKLKGLNSSYKIKTVRELDDADIIFIGRKTFDVITDYSWENRVSTELFKCFVASLAEKNLMDDYYLQKLNTALEFYTNEVIIIDYGTARLIYDTDISFHIKNDSNRGSERFLKVLPEYKDLYSKIIDKELYLEDAIYDYINGDDAITIDESMYEILCDMFKSDDTDNHVLAMEIMANCDYKSSILYLCYLFNSFRYQIEQRRERTHVNFKSLLTYMGLTPGNMYMDKDEMVNLMMKKKLFTKEYFFKLCEKFSNELIHSSSEHFDVKTVSSSDEVNQYFNEELVYQIKENYTPTEETITIQNEPTNTELDIV